jgi:hypothetical protein
MEILLKESRPGKKKFLDWFYEKVISNKSLLANTFAIRDLSLLLHVTNAKKQFELNL